MRTIGLTLALLSAWLAPPALVLGIVMAAGDALATRCDDISATYGGAIKFCEDFETPGYDVSGSLSAGHAWYDEYGAAAIGNCEGTGSTCTFDVVTEAACGASGETDCVHDGTYSLGIPYRNDFQGGEAGSKDWGPLLQTFGITMALRWSPTFAGDTVSTSCNPGEGNTGLKTDFFESSGGTSYRNCMIGCSGGPISQASSSRPNGGNTPGWPAGTGTPEENPFAVIWNYEECANAVGGPSPMGDNCDLAGVTRTKGWVTQDDFHLNFFPDLADYEWGVTHTTGQWMCVQVHVSGWGSSSGQMRYWIDGEKAIDISGLDLTKVGDDPNGIDTISFDGYFNDCYGGATTAYRYEDNVVVTSASEPVPCSAIGFAAGSTCGDGSLDAGESCDDGDTSVTACVYGDSPPLTQVCSADCLDATVDCAGPTYCGDSVVQAGEGEQCDPPGASCDASCQTILSPPGQPAYMPWRAAP